MPALVLSFPGRRYHATPWGHHVNEGLIEWPPSPWRLLRALLSVGYATLGWPGDVEQPWASQPPTVAATLLGKLAEVLPRYHLPPAVGSHTRHYMPLGALDSNGREKTTLVFDTWAQIDAGELHVLWDVDLSGPEHALMALLARHLSYLGRSESWVQARWLADDTALREAATVRPCAGLPSPGPDWEQVALLAPEPAAVFEAWRAEHLQRVLAPFPLPEGRRAPAQQLLKKRALAAAPYPGSVLACLQTDTAWQRSFGWSQPPGSRKVLYWRRADALRAPAAASPRRLGHGDVVPFVLMALATESRNPHALPTLARSLPQGEMLHRQLVAARLKLAPHEAPSVLAGRDAQRRALRGPHQHAHLLSLDLDEDGHIDHLLAWAPAGLDDTDQQALRMARGTYTKGGVSRLALAWAASGQRADLLQLAQPHGVALAKALGESRHWISATPFVPPRHLKRRGHHTLEGQVQAELASRGLPAAAEVRWLDPHDSELARQQRLHVRRRRQGPAPPVDLGLTLQLRFEQPVWGPLCLGYGSHFGLGRFEVENLAVD